MKSDNRRGVCGQAEAIVSAVPPECVRETEEKPLPLPPPHPFTPLCWVYFAQAALITMAAPESLMVYKNAGL